MKTIEEKAKRYDEIVDKVLHKYKSIERALSHIEVKNILQDLVPELAESEDEKIRKGLIEFVQEYGDKFYSQVAKSSAIAYLEKQGEQKPVECMYSKDNYTDEDRKVLCDGCQEECKFKPVEWSEEDETYSDYILTNCMNYADKMGYVEEKDNRYLHQNAKDWLKDLKNRCTPQPKHPQKQWKPSEEQMEALRRVKAAIAGEGVLYNPLNSLLEQLKAL